MKIISVREQPAIVQTALAYFQKVWPDVHPQIYEDAILNCVHAKNDLPQWYLLYKEDDIIGCAGLITNDFISRGDLYPWLCGLFIEEAHRGNRYPKYLFDRLKKDTKSFGFTHMYLCTEHTKYYEQYGFAYIGDGMHPWGETSRIYEIAL